MTSVRPAVDEFMAAGESALNRGDPREALSQFSYASMLAEDDRTKAQAEQSAGICHRLLGNYRSARAILGIAYGYAEDDLHRGRIKRDWGMVDLDQGDAGAAMKLFNESLELIRKTTSEDSLEGEARIEYFVTLGFIGRAYLALGEPDTARIYLHTADGQLQGHAPYELNNLVWWMKACSFRRRRKLAPRAWKLAREAGNRNRQVQVLLTAASPTFARLIETRR